MGALEAGLAEGPVGGREGRSSNILTLKRAILWREQGVVPCERRQHDTVRESQIIANALLEYSGKATAV